MILFCSISSIEGVPSEVDLESGHQAMNALVEVLQRYFKRETGYERPLMPPQANIIFVLDKKTAEAMKTYMTAKLESIGCFERDEFHFIHKAGSHGEVLQRLRLEFSDGLSASVICKLKIAKDRLEKDLAALEN